MIPISDTSWQTLSWQEVLKTSIKRVDDLLRILNLPKQPHFSEFPILVPSPFLSRIEKGKPNDPLLLQILSSKLELTSVRGFSEQPLQESKYSPIEGMIQKYHGRLLIITTGACAINCRYCFRRHFPYSEFQPDTRQWQELIRFIAKDSSISEVILSGGDPLMLPDRRLKWIVDQLAEISHISTLRLHTRMPAVVPQRVNDELLAWMLKTKLKVVLVNHINHANEIDGFVATAMQKLQQAGVTLLNQSVLLKNVNDSTLALTNLSERLFSAGILPYYLHLLDPVAGAAHFNISSEQAVQLMTKLRERLPGYLVPKLVKEIPGKKSKQPIY